MRQTLFDRSLAAATTGVLPVGASYGRVYHKCRRKSIEIATWPDDDSIVGYTGDDANSEQFEVRKSWWREGLILTAENSQDDTYLPSAHGRQKGWFKRI